MKGKERYAARLITRFTTVCNVSKVSARFEFFLSGFAYEPVLILILAMLDAEFYSLSIGITFKGGHQEKTGDFGQNTRKNAGFAQ